MSETMNNEMEFVTVKDDVVDSTENNEVEEFSSGPSKGFVGLVVGGIAVAAVGVAVAIKRHKAKKANAQKEEGEFDKDLFEEDTSATFTDPDIDSEVKVESP